jgi:hypothetical protein
MKQIIISMFVLFYWVSYKCYGQNIFDSLELNIGYSFQKQDRRLFDFRYQTMIIDHENTFYDYQYDVNINAMLLNNKTFIISGGLGYSNYKSKFSRPFKASYFGEGFDILRLVGTYTAHSLVFINTNKIILTQKKNNSLSFMVPIRFNFTFNKHVMSNENDFNKNKFLFQFNNFEIFMGLNGRLGKFTGNISYRIFNYQLIDKLFFNNLIIYDSNSPFFDNKYEVKNFDKIMINLGYTF